MANQPQAVDQEQLLPYERAGNSGATPEQSLSDLLASDPEFSGEETTEADESAPDEEFGESEDFVDEAEAEAADEADEFEDELDEDGSEEEPDDEPLYEVSVDGETVEVSFEELKSGYSRTADYTRKTQALAEQRKQIESEAEAYREAREQYASKLDVLEQAVAQTVPQEPDWDALRAELTDEQFAARWAQYQLQRKRLDEVQGLKQQVTAEQQADYEAQKERIQTEEMQKLREAIPQLQDPEEGPRVAQALHDYATQDLGYTPDLLKEVMDHRLFVILDKARRYDKLQQEGSKVREKAKKAKKLPPGGKRRGASKRPTKRKAFSEKRAQLARTGRVTDAASAIELLIAQEED